MRLRLSDLELAALVLFFSAVANGQTLAEPVKPTFDADLARTVGADDHGMRKFVLVILRSGPKKVPAGKERDEMFKGHFANIKRLSTEGKLALAGPLDGLDGCRGLFIFAVADLGEARKLVATDPVIIQGEMIAECHEFYGSAALMLVRDAHERIARKGF
jgi:uncharacterized protein YciI